MTEEQRGIIQDAIVLIEEAQEMVDQALSRTSQESSYYAYGRYGFDQLLGNGNPHDSSLQSLLEEEVE